jgi:hypothetical protein
MWLLSSFLTLRLACAKMPRNATCLVSGFLRNVQSNQVFFSALRYDSSAVTFGFSWTTGIEALGIILCGRLDAITLLESSSAAQLVDCI